MVRSPIQVDEEFRKRLKKIQEGIMRKEGKFKSIPKITKEITSHPEFNIIEKKILGEMKQLEVNLKFDRRRLE